MNIHIAYFWQSNRPYWFPLLILMLLAGLSACGKSPDEHLQEAQKLISQSNHKSAILELKSILQKQPDNTEVRLLLGRANFQTGAFQDAEKELTMARNQGATAEQVLPLLAKTLLRLGKFKEVIDLAVPASGVGSHALAVLHTARSEALISTDRRPEAEAALSSAMQLEPKLPDLILLQAKIALADKKQDRAAQFIDDLLLVDPKSTEALYIKAALSQFYGRPDDAVELYKQILVNDPSEYRAHLSIASIQLLKGNVDGAEQAIQAAEKVAGNAVMVKYTRGMFELQRGNLGKASSYLLDVLKSAPNHIPTILAYAQASYRLGHYSQSTKNAGIVLGADPGNLGAARILASSQIKLGDVEGALKTIEPLLAKYPNDARLQALAGDAYLRTENYNKAMVHLDRAAALEPDNSAIKIRLATSHMGIGNSSIALAELEDASRIDAKSGQADLALVLLKLNAKEYDQAIQAISNLEKKLPKNPLTLNMRAVALLGKKDLPGARKALEEALAIQPTFVSAAINLARMDVQDHKHEAARNRFISVLAADKNNVTAMLALAELASAEKKDKEFVDWLTKAINTAPKTTPAYHALVHHYLANNNNTQALALARRAADADADNTTALELLGNTQLAIGNKDAAIATYTRITQKAPQSPSALLKLGLAEIADNRLDTARETLTRALKLKSGFLGAQDAMMRLELLDKKPGAALQIARNIQIMQPDSPIGYSREADILLSQGKYSQAVRGYERSLAKAANTDIMIKLNSAMRKLGDTKTADQRLSTWLNQNPKDQMARDFAAVVYTQSNRNREAIEHYLESLRLNPSNALALNNLACLYQSEKDPRALATAEQAVKLAPNNPIFEDTLAWILLEQGQTPRALDLFRKAIKKAPNLGSLRYHYAVGLAKSGDKESARKELEQAINSGNNFPELNDTKEMLKSLRANPHHSPR